ncbi:FRAS1-related extracellular matrix protein 1-like [Centruroides sculpturatus]|uniref:FRAS1-related extracellular matrix protein 1-like n=1 Tax=Centruroides sculpturatus TaxID=218467 RepID=UPI000C6EDEBA|nr:FRAS1-related extracellular matrix protein 1-like [Centruroides sculpturatus]
MNILVIVNCLYVLVVPNMAQLLLYSKEIEVPIGREIYLTKNDLLFHTIDKGLICKVEVVTNEPMTQRVGLFEPQIFDCNFQSRMIKYTHFGSPLLKQDIVKFSAYLFQENATLSERFSVVFNILNLPYNVTQTINPLTVKEFFGLSNLIDDNVLKFKYSKSNGAVCKARFTSFQSKRPAHGQIVVGTDKRPIDVIKRRCDEFLKLGLRYEHFKPPSPNIDYIIIVVEVSDPLLNNGEPYIEWIHLPVIIEPGFPNLKPKASFSSMYLMDVDQFILTTITPAVLSGLDGETSSELLIFNISKPLDPSNGTIVHLSDHTKPITSFLQADVNNFEIAFKPPIRSFNDREMFEVGFNIFDMDYAASDLVTLHIAVRAAVTSAPRVSINTGLVLLEGQSRCILPENLEIVDSDNIDDVKMFITGGLLHGKLEIDGVPGIVITQKDLKEKKVIYYHDDSDTTKDSIHLRIFDGTHSTHTKFPITIIPRDDNIPALIMNVGLKVEEGRTVKISSDFLSAHDQDTSDDFLIFILTKPPKAGTIWKMFLWETTGNEVTQFTQRDINKGVIYYHHFGNEVFIDEFEVMLQDMNDPPNKSPPHKVSVVIKPIGDDPPKKSPKCSLSLEIPEVQIGIITKAMLHYQDSDSKDHEIVYLITNSPKFIGSYAKSGTGKIISLADHLVSAKDAKIPAIHSFTQEEVNHHKIGYMPPIEDIGPYPLYLQFVFTVTDKQSNAINSQLFNITLLPVNNQAPQLHIGELLVDEGSSTLISTNEISVYDPDTLTSELQISLFTVPLHGSLRRSGQPLRVGDLLSLDDILMLLLEYVHDGSESHQDSFNIGVNDGIHFVSGEINIKVEPIDDETPVWKRGLLQEIKTEEGGQVQITSEVLAATDVDTGDTLLHFILTEVPAYGIILVDDRMVSRFTQLDVMKGKVYYKHNGQEIGPHSKRDTFTLIVTDRAFPRLISHPSHKVLVTILPTNSHIPQVSFRKSILVEEGQTAPISEDILTTRDDDTLPSLLQYVIFQQPQYGLIENLRRQSGYERNNKGKSVDTFTQQDIKDGYVNYVQSKHRKIEPESDEFRVYVTDGIHNSSAVLIFVNIILRNDEEPQVSANNITVKEAGFHPINSEVLSVTDHDYPSDILSVHLKTLPSFGSLKQRIQHRINGPTVELEFTELTIDRFLQNVIYQHDGSENFNDHFTLIISDGVHNIAQTIFVNIIPINDEYPKLVKNIRAYVKPGESVFLSSALLLAQDEDSLPKDIVYIILSPPTLGKLQRRDSLNGTWNDLTYPMHFTQLDANLNLIRYQHSDFANPENEDSFLFLISDKIHNSSINIFQIGIKMKNFTFQIISKTPSLQAGTYIMITSSFLTVTGNNYNFENVTFHLTQHPKYGQLELISHPGKAIKQFHLFDIIGRRLLYNQTKNVFNNLTFSNIRNISDNFTFVVDNGNFKTNSIFNIIINFPQSDKYNFPILHSVHSLNVVGTSSVINRENLNASDLKFSQDKVIFMIVEEPKYGTILKENKKVTNFTQEDINRGKISYHHRDNRSTFDSLAFEVTNEEEKGYILDGKLQTKATKMDIFIRPRLSSSLPNITLLEQMEYFGTGKSGFILTTDSLKPNNNTNIGKDLIYTIHKPPQYGYLVYRETGEIVSGAITQQDINDHRITFVINGENQEITNDSMTFRIVDENGNLVAEQRLNFHWAIIYFAYPEYAVCEDVGSIDIEVLRSGDVLHSSFVTVTAIGQSAEEGLDYLSGRAKLIQFDPGQTSAIWRLQIIDDNIEESSVEQIQLYLTNPINAVISKKDITLISIHDKRGNNCQELPAPTIVKVSQEKFNGDQADNPQKFIEKDFANCSPTIFGLLQYNYSTGKLYQCNGHQWIPWEPRPRTDEVQPVSREILIDNSMKDENLKKNRTKSNDPNLNNLNSFACQKGWKEYENKCYKLFKQQLSWNEAEMFCQNQNQGHLASVFSNEHNKWLIKLTKNRPFWIGLHASTNHTTWNYTSDSPLTFTNWKEGFPRISKVGSIKLKCVLVRGTGHWINRLCDYNHSYVCVYSQNFV